MDFEAIYKNYWQQIFRLCMGYTNDYEMARDMAQETFIAVWKQLPGFRHEASIGTWIYRIATNLCLRHIEKVKRYPIAEFPEHLQEENYYNLEPNIKLLYQFIAELPEIDRIIISLELENIKQTEIADITGMTEANIRVRIHRIKEKLTQKFKQNEQ
ncbi:MAG TPA: RNA polymerase sigma factor [Chitinophagales bacterium]|nr:RNA polymerase sigma factor [Chitinophagales bacterium]